MIGSAPKITRPPKSTVVEVKSSIFISCYADGSPPPSYSWLINNRVIRDDDPYKKTETFINGPSQLRIFEVKQGSANYTCVADNGIGEPATAVAKIIAIPGKAILIFKY
ncbi:Tyrosine-protein phosphatase Lar-like [Trichoplax sp. H2]|nr:Tyrosine-protein phosphatase Lar-like [Trichoplax sp. H2]|eukprot:RDD42222.1 Tyrosine-protein phosphatase Lar-like [Trichoplax sp. H2]